MTAVVTGASGYIGSNLVRELLKTDRTVIAVDQNEPTELMALGAIGVQADVRDQQALTRAYQHASVVFHLAAIISVAGSRGGLVQSVNVDGVRASAHAALAAGVPRFVHCSSVHAFDLMACKGRVVTESSPKSTHPKLPVYDLSKAAGEEQLLTVISDGLGAVILNPTGVIGPVDRHPSRMGAVLLAAARGALPATVKGSFDWVDVRDVVRALMAAEHRGTVGENYLVGGHSASISELAAIAARHAGVTPPVADLPLSFAKIFSPIATHLARRSSNPLLYTFDSLHALESEPRVDHSKSESVLGITPRDLEVTVRDFLVDSDSSREVH